MESIIFSYFTILSLFLLLTSATPYSGNSGYGIYFNHEAADVIGWEWKNIPPRQVTVEYWIYVTDHYQDTIEPVAYSAYDGGRSYDAPDEFWVKNMKIGKAVMSRYDVSVTCTHIFVYGTQGSPWFHWAHSWDANTGNVLFYLNGLLVCNTTGQSTFLKDIVPDGCATIGQEPDSLCGGWNSAQALDGIFDELRVWSVVRTPHEIFQNYNISVDPNHPDLNMYLRFDDYQTITSKKTAEDLSGNGNDGGIALLPDLKNVMSYSDGRGNIPHTIPRCVATSAPIYGSGLQVMDVEPNVLTVITLSAKDPTGAPLVGRITALPTKGNLTQYPSGVPIRVNDILNDPSLRVWYTSAFPQGDNFQFEVTNNKMENASAVVQIRQYNLSVTPNKIYKILQETITSIILGGISDRGEELTPILTTLPDFGRLFQAAFKKGQIETYDVIETNVSLLVEITDIHTPITNPHGIVLYLPPLGVYSPDDITPCTSFQYTYYLNNIPQSGIGNISIIVIEVPIPPIANDTEYNVNFDSLVPIQLVAKHVNPSNTTISYQILQLPVFGTLYQVDDHGHLQGAIMDSTEDEYVVTSWISEVLDVSSQYSQCAPDCNWIQSCAAIGGCLISDAYLSNHLEGPFDVYPFYGTYEEAFMFLADRGTPDNPIVDYDGTVYQYEYIEAMINAPMYLTKIEVYETLRPGTIVAIKVAEEYLQKQTNWTTIWRQDKAEAQPEIARIFSPPLCFYPKPVQYIRIEIDSVTIPGLHAYDAVQFTGKQDIPRGQILNNGKIVYVPQTGIHTISADVPFDSFTWQASDCQQVSSNEYTVTIMMSDHIWNNTVRNDPFKVINYLVLSNVQRLIQLDFKEIIADYYLRFGSSNWTVTAANISEFVTLNNVNKDKTPGSLISKTNQINGLSIYVQYNSNSNYEIPITFFVTSTEGVSYDLRVNLLDCDFFIPNNLSDSKLILDFSNYCYHKFDVSVGTVILGYVLSTLGLVVTLGIFGFVVAYRNTIVMIRASVRYIYVFLLGILCAYILIGIFSASQLYASNNLCQLQIAFGVLSFGLVFSVLLSKTFRMHMIFTRAFKNQVKKNSVIYDDVWLLRIVIPLILLFILLFVLWLSIDAPTVQVRLENNITYTECKTNQYWILIFCAIAGFLLLWGVYLSWVTQKLPNAFNESKWIGYSIYNVTLFGVILFPLAISLYSNPSVLLIIETIPTFICVSLTLAFTIAPKMYYIYNKVELSTFFKDDELPSGSLPVKPTTSVSISTTTNVKPASSNLKPIPPGTKQSKSKSKPSAESAVSVVD